MMGAKVNGAIVPIDRVPQNGDIIEIITSQASKGPSRDWLKIVKTGEARSKIRQWFKREKRTENIALGRSEVEREVRRYIKGVTEDKLDEAIASVAKKVGINSADDFYNTLGFGGLSLSRFLNRIRDELERIGATETPQVQTPVDEIAQVKIVDTSKKKKSTGGIVIDGEPGCQVKFAKCCNPLPGDKIVGFVTRGFGVSIHKSDCPNVSLSRRNEENLSRWVRAEWEKSNVEQTSSYEALLQIVVEDQIGVIAAISLALADMKVSISQIYTQSLKGGGVIINLHVACKSTSHYESIVSRLRSIPSIISVTRGFSS
jgi:GTP pyrophosphokinase